MKFRNLFCSLQMLNKERDDEVCDARDDATCIAAD